MDSKNNIKIRRLIISFSIVLALYSCNLKCSKDHAPIMPYYVYPNKEKYNIGDTIWLEARMPFVMKDFETENMPTTSMLTLNPIFI